MPSSRNRPARTTLGDPSEFGLPPTLRAPVPAEPEPDPYPTPVPRRGRGLARFALLAAVLTALALGGCSYVALASVHLITPHPLNDIAGWLILLAVVAVATVAAFGVSVLALFWCRPRLLAGLAVAASIVLPVLTVAVGATFGVGAAQQNLAADLAREPAAAADLALDTMSAWQVDAPAPVRDLLRFLAARDG